MPLTPEQIAEWKRIVREADPSTWVAVQDPVDGWSVETLESPPGCGVTEVVARRMYEEQARFLAAASVALPALLSEREEMLEALSREGFSVVEHRGRLDVVRPCTCTVAGDVCPRHREEAALSLLREVEWGQVQYGYKRDCLFCHEPSEGEGHAPGCRLSSLLRTP